MRVLGTDIRASPTTRLATGPLASLTPRPLLLVLDDFFLAQPWPGAAAPLVTTQSHDGQGCDGSVSEQEQQDGLARVIRLMDRKGSSSPATEGGRGSGRAAPEGGREPT